MLAAQAKKYRCSLFLEAGGNRVFFVNGVLKVLAQEGIHIDHVMGFSSSSAVLFAYLNNANDDILRVFADRLRANKSNFYFFTRPHFPHTAMYASSVSYLLGLPRMRSGIAYSIIAARTSSRFAVERALLASFALALKYSLHIPIAPLTRLLGIGSITVTDVDDLGKDELLDLIVGSSTIYPFIGLHYFKGSLLLDGALTEPEPALLNESSERVIIIHTAQGMTREDGSVLHMYSDSVIPLNVLDYTDPDGIVRLHAAGERSARLSLPLIRKFLAKALP
ncbi:MAG: patatin-like phospholipase family protein, partial [Candidatus Paceibacterota bacterium]